MAKEILKLKIFDIGANGKGVSKNNGLVCFVPYCLPGETVVASTVKKEKNFCECSLNEIVEPSKERITPVCQHFSTCGGCQLQHANYETELNYKTKQVKTMLEKELKQELVVNKCIGMNEYNWRNKINFSIYNNKLCFVGNDGKNFEVKNCPVFVENLSEIIEVFNTYFSLVTHKFTALHVRVLDKTYQFTLISNETYFPKSEKLISLLQQKNIRFSLFICKNTILNSSNITQNLTCVFGEEKQDYFVFNIKNKISPASFLQVNEQIQNLIYEDINSKVFSSNIVINAYGGTGILSSVLAKNAKKVYSIEINKKASENCKEMIKENNIKNIISVCGDCKVEIPKILKTEEPSHIVFDPPRSGIDKTILESVLSFEISTIIYLSCNPSTLARDLSILKSKYKISSIQPYNMFPKTCHVETLVVLSKI